MSDAKSDGELALAGAWRRGSDDGILLPSQSESVRLPPGPATAPQEVRAHQRARLCGAMVELAAEHDYDALTVAGIAERARVSKHTLYEHFSGKDDCFLQTYQELAARLAHRVRAAQREQQPQADQERQASQAEQAESVAQGRQASLRHTLAVLLEQVVCDPQVARVLLLSPFAAGQAVFASMRQSEARCKAALIRGLALDPSCTSWIEPIARAAVAGLVRVARMCVAEGREQELIDATDELADWVIAICRVDASSIRRLRRLSMAAGDLASGRENRRREIVDPRELIFEAVATLLANGDRSTLTLGRIRLTAQLSPREFREHFQFEDINACVLATAEHLMTLALARAVLAGQQSPDWASGVYRALRSICLSIARDATFAKVCFTELLARGDEGMRCRERLIDGLARRVYAQAGAERRPGKLIAAASVAGVWRLAHDEVAAGRARSLPRLTPLLAHLLLAPVPAERRAERIAVAEAPRRASPAAS